MRGTPAHLSRLCGTPLLQGRIQGVQDRLRKDQHLVIVLRQVEQPSEEQVQAGPFQRLLGVEEVGAPDDPA